MINDLVKYLKGKKIIILGFGREGKSTYKLIRKYLKEQTIYIADQKEKTDFLENDKNAVYIGGEVYLKNLEEYDLIIKTPGISFVGIDTSKYIHREVKSSRKFRIGYLCKKR